MVDLLVRVDGVLFRLDARQVRRVVEIDRVTPVPGLPSPAEGVALAEDRLVVVVRVGAAVGPGQRLAVLYDVNESQIALVGAEIAGFGEDAEVPRFDVEGLFGRIEESVWAARAARRSLGRDIGPDSGEA